VINKSDSSMVKRLNDLDERLMVLQNQQKFGHQDADSTIREINGKINSLNNMVSGLRTSFTGLSNHVAANVAKVGKKLKKGMPLIIGQKMRENLVKAGLVTQEDADKVEIAPEEESEEEKEPESEDYGSEDSNPEERKSNGDDEDK